MKITNNITVGGVMFAQWFNERVKPYHHCFENFVNPLNFDVLMQNLEVLVGKEEMSLEEFCGHFAIIYNETGGTFSPLREFGEPAYMFSQLLLSNGGQKMSYNTLRGNVPAGTRLEQLKYELSSKQRDLWNGHTFPISEPEAMRIASLEADYWKFRGFGFNQLTGRSNFQAFLQPHLPKKLDDYRREEWDALLEGNIILAAKCFHDFAYKNPLGADAMMHMENGNFQPYGNLVSGNWTWYVLYKFLPRANTLYNLMKQQGEHNITSLAEWAIDGLALTHPQIIYLQQQINAKLAYHKLPYITVDGWWGAKSDAALLTVAQGRQVREVVNELLGIS